MSALLEATVTEHLTLGIPFDKYTLPVDPSPDVLNQRPGKVNCQGALQRIVWIEAGKLLSAAQSFSMEGYLDQTVPVLAKGDTPELFKNVPPGTRIFAQKLRDRSGRFFTHQPRTLEEYAIQSHQAYYLGGWENIGYLLHRYPSLAPKIEQYGREGRYVYHATWIEGKSCIWEVSQFCHYYTDMTAKELPHS